MLAALLLPTLSSAIPSEHAAKQADLKSWNTCLSAIATASVADVGVHLEHLECSLQPSPPGCFTRKLSEARSNGIGVVAAGEAALP